MKPLKTVAVMEIALSSVVACTPFILFIYDTHFGDGFLYSPFGWYIGDIFWIVSILGVVILSLSLWTLRISKSVNVEKETVKGSLRSGKRKKTREH